MMEKTAITDNVSISKYPVRNREYCLFLNHLARNGIFNETQGTYLFVNTLIHPNRGGRIYRKNNYYYVFNRFENHPVNWVNWYGAYFFAMYSGGYLPESSELLRLDEKLNVHEEDNHVNKYKFGDTKNVLDCIDHSSGIVNFIDNVKIWCCDWSVESFNTQYKVGLFKNVFGFGWNSVNFEKKITNKLINLSARSTGIRVFFDKNTINIDHEVVVSKVQKYISQFQFVKINSLADIYKINKNIENIITYKY